MVSLNNEKTALVYSEKYLLHNPGPRHPEVPLRLRVIMRDLKKNGMLDNKNCLLFDPKPVGNEDLELVHKKNYINKILDFCRLGGGLLDREDTIVSKDSCDVALLAAGGTIDAVDHVMNGKVKNAFALVRPPGHHAGPDYSMGFCVLNNIALAASHLVNKFDLSRVLILDIDAHHGNGTQDIFYKRDDILFISIINV